MDVPAARQEAQGRGALDKSAEQTSTGGSTTEEQSALKEWIELLVRAGIWAVFIYLFLFQVSVVEQDSMNPTIHEGDKLVIDKLTYRLGSVHRLDVIVFETTDTSASGTERRPKDYIKRVIGLPGETIEVHDDDVWIKDADGTSRLLKEPFWPTRSDRRTYVVPPHHYLVMGDNRYYSKDSRITMNREGREETLGFVPETQIRGIVRLRFWHFSRWTWFSRKN